MQVADGDDGEDDFDALSTSKNKNIREAISFSEEKFMRLDFIILIMRISFGKLPFIF